MAAIVAAAGLIFSVAGAGSAFAAGGVQAGAAIHAGNGNGNNGNGNGNGNGNNGNGNGNGSQTGSGQGTATPELPSGVLFSFGLIPLAIGFVLLWRRREQIGRAHV